MRILLSKGFTLLEIMIVIAILGVLAAALFPSYNSYVERGRDTSRISDVDSLSKTITLYYSEKEDFPVWDVAGCVNESLLVNYGVSSISDDPKPTHNNGCATDGKYGYGMSTGIALASPDEFSLISYMEQPFGGNYTGGVIGFTGLLLTDAYLSGTTLVQKGTGPIYVRIP